jgi:hypothetical protein
LPPQVPVQEGTSGGHTAQRSARIYILVGEPDKALDIVQSLITFPYYLSPGWLRIDPNFAPLRGNPRFERLIAQGTPTA